MIMFYCFKWSISPYLLLYMYSITNLLGFICLTLTFIYVLTSLRASETGQTTHQTNRTMEQGKQLTKQTVQWNRANNSPNKPYNGTGQTTHQTNRTMEQGSCLGRPIPHMRCVVAGRFAEQRASCILIALGFPQQRILLSLTVNRQCVCLAFILCGS